MMIIKVYIAHIFSFKMRHSARLRFLLKKLSCMHTTLCGKMNLSLEEGVPTLLSESECCQSVLLQ